MLIGLRTQFEYFQCGVCRCLQIKVIPENLGDYYPPDYYSLTVAGQDRPAPKGIRRIINGLMLLDSGPVASAIAAVARRKMVASHPVSLMPMTRDAGISSFGDRLLDVGCGGGAFLRSLKDRGFTDLHGVDPFISADVVLPGLSIRKCAIGDLTGVPPFKAILFQHSLEHLEHQVEVLAAARELLQPDGTVVIQIPVVDSYAWEHYGVDWVDLDAPRHLFLHSLDSLQRVARQAGFTRLRTVPQPAMIELLGSEQYRRDVPLRSPESYVFRGAAAFFGTEELARFTALRNSLRAVGKSGRVLMYLNA